MSSVILWFLALYWAWTEPGGLKNERIPLLRRRRRVYVDFSLFGFL